MGFPAKYRTLAFLLSLTVLSTTALSSFAAEKNTFVLYRYTNANGVTVINSSIPAEYAQQGYEVISKAGEVLEVIPRAPSKSEIAAADAQRKTLETFKQLQRRYSDVSDIERAKQRRLDNIDTNIKILSGTISNLESNNDDLVRNAAEFERKGRSVPHTILRQIEDGKKELSVSKDILEYRYLEYKETEKKFDSDIQAYIEGSKLEKKLEQEQAELERLAKQR